jgi:hypothetical protein
MELAVSTPQLSSRSPHCATTLDALYFSATCYSSTLIDDKTKPELEIVPKFFFVSQQVCTEGRFYHQSHQHPRSAAAKATKATGVENYHDS